MVGVWSLRILQSVDGFRHLETGVFPADCPHRTDSYFPCPTSENGCDTSEYRRILGVSSIWPTTHRIVSDAGGSTHCTLWEFYLRHICYYLQIRKRLGHFCLAPHVAMRVGLYLHPFPQRFGCFTGLKRSRSLTYSL